jgi:hypothetical protein
VEASRTVRKRDDAYARMNQMAKEDPDALRSVIETMIAKQPESEGDNSAWDPQTNQIP